VEIIDDQIRMSRNSFDVIVVGAGSAGLTAAEFAVKVGRKTLLVEKDRVGGDCTWFGCVPSKAFIHGAAENKVLAQAANLQRLHDSVQRKISDIYALESPDALAEKGVEVLHGEVKFISMHKIEVKSKSGETRELESKFFVVATGALPKFPCSIEGLKEVDAWDYQTVWNVTKLPDSLMVIGTGPIGSELSQAFARLGTQVSLVGTKLLPREIERAREIVTKAFEEDGIKMIHSRPTKVTRNDDGNMTVTMQDGSSHTIQKIMYAIGRNPIVPDGLKDIVGEAGIGRNGGLLVNSKLQCRNANNIFAAGDCIDGNIQFTHYAGFQGFVAARNAILLGTNIGDKPQNVPRVTFTSPEVGAVGLNTVEAAKKVGFPYATRISWNGPHIDRAVCESAEASTFVELILENSTSPSAKIIGGNAVGPRGGETLCEIALCVNAKIPLDKLAGTIHPYPTYGFALNQLAYEETANRLLKSTKGKIAANGCSIL